MILSEKALLLDVAMTSHASDSWSAHTAQLHLKILELRKNIGGKSAASGILDPNYQQHFEMSEPPASHVPQSSYIIKSVPCPLLSYRHTRKVPEVTIIRVSSSKRLLKVS